MTTPQGPAWLSCYNDAPGSTAAPAAASLLEQPAFQTARALALQQRTLAVSAPLLQICPFSLVIPLSLNSLACPLSLWDCLVLKADTLSAVSATLLLALPLHKYSFRRPGICGSTKYFSMPGSCGTGEGLACIKAGRVRFHGKKEERVGLPERQLKWPPSSPCDTAA